MKTWNEYKRKLNEAKIKGKVNLKKIKLSRKNKKVSGDSAKSIADKLVGNYWKERDEELFKNVKIIVDGNDKIYDRVLSIDIADYEGDVLWQVHEIWVKENKQSDWEFVGRDDGSDFEGDSDLYSELKHVTNTGHNWDLYDKIKESKK